MDDMSSIRRDFLVSHLREQINNIRALIGAIENEGRTDCDYAGESLKTVESNIRRIRKLCRAN